MKKMTVKEIKKYTDVYIQAKWSDGDEDFSVNKIMEKTFHKPVYAYECLDKIETGTVYNSLVAFFYNRNDEYSIIELIKDEILLKLGDRKASYSQKLSKEKIKFFKNKKTKENIASYENKLKTINNLIKYWEHKPHIEIIPLSDVEYSTPDVYPVGTKFYMATTENGFCQKIEWTLVKSVSITEDSEGYFKTNYTFESESGEITHMSIVDSIDDYFGKGVHWYAKTKDELKEKMIQLYNKEIKFVQSIQ